MALTTSFENRLIWLTLTATLPAALLAVGLLWANDYSSYLVALVAVLLGCQIAFVAFRISHDTSHQLQTMANLLEGLTHGDYSMRGHQQARQGALAELVVQINQLADTLSRQRLEVKESQLLLAKIIRQINVAIFTLDENNRFALVNTAAASLLNGNEKSLKGKAAADYQIDQLLTCEGQVVQWTFPAGSGRFQILCDQFIEHNRQHKLLFVTNVQNMLRDEERKAWQNLIRVISHEINNSLAPIYSLSQTLLSVLDQAGARDNLEEGLNVIGERAQSLRSFIDSYRQIAKLPSPNKVPLALPDMLQSLSALYPERKITLNTGQPVTFEADPSQLQQVLINLAKNACEARDDEGLEIVIDYHVVEGRLHLSLSDNGPGISNPQNLFTPFYTTKAKGSGIGLLLCRQIIEGHQGQLHIHNGEQGGCRVDIELPMN